jgi:molybdopterin-binding protein
MDRTLALDVFSATRSAEELRLKNGDKVTATIKATEVMIQKD